MEDKRCCGNTEVLVYSCSGGANVAEISDLAARKLMKEGTGKMFCLAGLGAEIEGMIQAARDAHMNLVIDGCPMDCAKKIFDKSGVTNYKQIKVTDLGIEKQSGAEVSAEQVDQVVKTARQKLDDG